MQAEHKEEEVGSEDAFPPIEAAELRSNTGEVFIRQLQHFLEEPLTV